MHIFVQCDGAHRVGASVSMALAVLAPVLDLVVNFVAVTVSMTVLGDVVLV